MSKAIQCDRCKSLEAYRYDFTVGKIVGAEGWMKLSKTSSTAVDSDISTTLGDLCPSCYDSLLQFVTNFTK